MDSPYLLTDGRGQSALFVDFERAAYFTAVRQSLRHTTGMKVSSNLSFLTLVMLSLLFCFNDFHNNFIVHVQCDKQQ